MREEMRGEVRKEVRSEVRWEMRWKIRREDAMGNEITAAMRGKSERGGWGGWVSEGLPEGW